MEDGTWRGKEREWEKRRGGETVSRVRMNSNENRGSNVPFLCRMGIDSLPLLQSNRALCPRPQVVQSQNKTIEQRQKEIDWHSKINQRNILRTACKVLTEGQKEQWPTFAFLHFSLHRHKHTTQTSHTQRLSNTLPTNASVHIQGHVDCSRWDRSARQPSLLPVFLEMKLCQRH